MTFEERRVAVEEAARIYKQTLVAFHRATKASSRAAALAECRRAYAALEDAKATAAASPEEPTP